MSLAHFDPTMPMSPNTPTPKNQYICCEMINNNNTAFSEANTNIAKLLPYSSSYKAESSISDIFDAEIDHALSPDSLMSYRSMPGISLDRHNAVNWMLKVHGYYKFQPATACLAVIYLDRFLSSRTLPRGKGWAMQLVSVTCLSLAAKMEETCVPSLLNLQVCEPTFLFSPETIQRMELLVMSSLKWRLRAITPFDFVHYFLTKVPCFGPSLDHFTCIYSTVSRLLISTCNVIEFLDYCPSVIAASAVVMVTGQSVDELNSGCFHKRDMVRKCYNLIENKYKLKHIEQQKPKVVGMDTFANGRSDEQKSSNNDLPSTQHSFTNNC